MSNRIKPYHSYSDYLQEPSGIRRIDYIVAVVDRYQQEVSRNPNILEIGCGNGNLSRTLAMLGYQVTAVDMDKLSIEKAKRNTPTGISIHFEVCSAEEIVTRKISYDIVICSEVLEHLKEPEGVAGCFYNLLKEDGMAIVTVPNGKCFEERVRCFLVKNPTGQIIRGWLKKNLLNREEHVQSSSSVSTHLQYFSLHEIRYLLQKSKLQICETENSSVFFREAYYMFLRLFLSRKSRLFRWLDDLDNCLAARVSNKSASGWFFLCKKSNNVHI